MRAHDRPNKESKQLCRRVNFEFNPIRDVLLKPIENSSAAIGSQLGQRDQNTFNWLKGETCKKFGIIIHWFVQK